jgi:hypothetical protein
MGSCHRGGTFTLFACATMITVHPPKRKALVQAERYEAAAPN